MYYVEHPLDWWASGGYTEVVRQTGWTLPRARREVRKAIKRRGWNPIGHTGYAELKKAILAGHHFDHELN